MKLMSYQGSTSDLLQSQSPENLKVLQSLLDYFEYIGIRHTGHSLTDNATYKSQIRQQIQDNDIQAARRSLARFKHDQNALRHYQWAVELTQKFNDELFWQKLSLTIPVGSSGQLKRLESRWRNHRDYAHVSSDGLYQLADFIIPKLEQYYTLALTELEQKRLRVLPEIYNSFKEYLTNLKAYLQAERSRLTNAMLRRLQVAARRRDLGHDDMITDMAESVKQLARLDDYTIHPPQTRMSDKHFEFFNAYLTSNANKHDWASLQKLPWYIANGYFYIDKTAQRNQIVPKQLVNRHRKLIRLRSVVGKFIPRVCFIDNYIVSKQYLLARLSLLSRADQNYVVDSNYINMAYVKQHQVLFNDLANELTALTENMPTGLGGFIFRRQRSKLWRWQQQLLEFQQTIITKQIQLLESMMAKAYALGRAGTDYLCLHKDAMDLLAKQIRDCHLSLYEKPLAGQLARRLDKLEANYRALFYDPDNNVIKLLLMELQHGSIKGNNHLRPLFDFQQGLQKYNSDAMDLFIGQCQPAMKVVAKKLLHALNIISFDVTSIIDADLLRFIARCITLLKTFADEHAHEKLRHSLRLIYSKYLQQIILTDAADLNLGRMMQIEECLLAICDPALITLINKVRVSRLTGKQKFMSSIYEAYLPLISDCVTTELICLTTRIEQMIYQALQTEFKFSGNELKRIAKIVAEMVASKTVDVKSYVSSSADKSLLRLHKPKHMFHQYLNLLIAIQQLRANQSDDVQQNLHNQAILAGYLQRQHKGLVVKQGMFNKPDIKQISEAIMHCYVEKSAHNCSEGTEHTLTSTGV